MFYKPNPVAFIITPVTLHENIDSLQAKNWLFFGSFSTIAFFFF